MKKYFVIAAMILVSVMSNAQDTTQFVRNGKNFEKTYVKPQSKDVETEFTYTIKGGTYPIWITKNGRVYIIRTSKKTGETYKQYLCEEIARQICKELGITYVEKQQ